MKLGLSQASYRWTCYPWLRYDRPEFRLSDRPLPYFTSVDPPKDFEPPLDWILERVRAHNLESIYLEAGWLGDEDGAERFRQKLEEGNMVCLCSCQADLAASADEWGATTRLGAKQTAAWGPRYELTRQGCGWTGGTPFARVVRAMELSSAAGARIFNLIHGEPNRTNHFTREPPIDVQLKRVTHNVASLMAVAEALDLVLTNESHMDYRVAEYVQVLEAIDSPFLRHTFDFANSIAVVEDPLEAAQLVAPFTVATHIKDMRVQSTTELGEPRFFHSPIGCGDVPVKEILKLFQAELADPDNLHHYVEVCTLPQYDADEWVMESVRWLRSECAGFWT